MNVLRDGLETIDFGDMAAGDVAGPEGLAPVTPGEILRDEFLVPYAMSARALARDIGVPANRVTDIINGDRGITAGTALKLAARFGTSARFWMNLQVSYDLAMAERAVTDAA